MAVAALINPGRQPVQARGERPALRLDGARRQRGVVRDLGVLIAVDMQLS